MAKRKPEVGDKIEHTEPHFDRVTTGTVVQILSAQFSYKTENGTHRMCMFNEQWKFLSK